MKKIIIALSLGALLVTGVLLATPKEQPTQNNVAIGTVTTDSDPGGGV